MENTSTKGNILHGKLKSQKELKKINAELIFTCDGYSVSFLKTNLPKNFYNSLRISFILSLLDSSF